MCGPHARSRVPPPSSSWYFTRYFLVAFLIPLQLRPGILKGIPDNKISFMPLSCQQCPTWYYYHYHLFNPCTYFCPLYAQNDSSIPNKIQPTACLVLPWVSLGPTLATEAAPAGAQEPRDVCVWVDRNCRQLYYGNTVITETALSQHWVMCELHHQRRTVTNHPSHMGNSNRGLRLHQLLNSHITYPTFYCIYIHNIV